MSFEAKSGAPDLTVGSGAAAVQDVFGGMDFSSHTHLLLAGYDPSLPPDITDADDVPLPFSIDDEYLGGSQVLEGCTPAFDLSQATPNLVISAPCLHNAPLAFSNSVNRDEAGSTPSSSAIDQQVSLNGPRGFVCAS